jgi:hypothetical protein
LIDPLIYKGLSKDGSINRDEERDEREPYLRERKG